MKKIAIGTVVFLLVIGQSCTPKTENQETMESNKTELTTIFPIGEKGSSEWFTGTA